MIKRLAIALVFSAFSSLTMAQEIKRFEATELENELKKHSDYKLIDVRTADEFSKGHLANSFNMDWRGGEFKNKISEFKKDEPLMIYCLSGARSDAAAQYLISQGFTNVSVLTGGILKWRANNLEEVKPKTSVKGLTKEAYLELLKSDKLVLVDFYANWCPPCMEMKPYIDKLAVTHKDKVKVVSINIDENSSLAKELGVSELPVLKLFKDEKQIWEKRSLVKEKELLKLIK